MSDLDENGWNEDDDALDAAILDEDDDDEAQAVIHTTTTTAATRKQPQSQSPYYPSSASSTAATAATAAYDSCKQQQHTGSKEPIVFASNPTKEEDRFVVREGWKDDDSVLEDLLLDDETDDLLGGTMENDDNEGDVVMNAAGIVAPHLTLNVPPHALITASTINMAEEENDDDSFSASDRVVPKNDWDGWENEDDDVIFSDLDASERDITTPHPVQTSPAVGATTMTLSSNEVFNSDTSMRGEGSSAPTIPRQSQSPSRPLAPHLHLNTIPDRRSLMMMQSAPTTASTVDLMVDGWYDEEGLVDDDSTNESHKNDNSFPSSLSLKQEPYQEEEFGDYGDGKRQYESQDDRKKAAAVSIVKQIPIEKDGWSENDHVEEVDDLLADGNNNNGIAQVSSRPNPNQVAMPRKAPSPFHSSMKDTSDGWNDDDDDFFNEDDDLMVEEVKDNHNYVDYKPISVAKPPPKAVPSKKSPPPTKNEIPRMKQQETVKAKTVDGWDNDDDDFFDDDDNNDAPVKPASMQTRSIAPARKQPTSPPPVPSSSNAMVMRLSQELHDYLFTLPAHAKSVAAVLQAEYNTPEKAFELKQYYVERPALEVYTIQKELARMEYMLTDHTGSDVITDKHIIARQVAGSLCARCANQSLLADMLQVLTGHDRVVRPQYFASAIASTCRFRIDLQHSLTEAVAALELSLPSAHGRWKVAEIRVMIIFGCGAMPFVEYRLADICMIATPNDRDWRQRLEQTAALLSDLFAHEEVPPALSPPPLLQQQQQGQNFRDVFLQSQSVAMEAAAAMKSAWQDIDAATGFGQKIRQLPAFLPDASVLAAAEEEERRTSVARKSRAEAVQRPTSILGGFVSKLAKSVVLPDEDPELYEDWNRPSKPLPADPPQLYKKAPPAMPKPPANMPDNAAFPRLYKKEASPLPSKLQEPLLQPSVMNEKKSAEAAFVMLPKQNTPDAKTSKPDIPNLDNKGMATLTPEIGKNLRSSKPIPLEPEDFSAPSSGHHEVSDENPVHIKAALDDQDKDFLQASESKADHFASSKTPVKYPPLPSQKIGWEYDPVTDIIPTRKRWVHSRPGPRELRALSSFQSQAVTQH
jgi:hypothetical protein